MRTLSFSGLLTSFLGLTRILFSIAHTAGSPDWTRACRPYELLQQIPRRIGVSMAG